MSIIKPDWDKFKAKFSENPQDEFEWFCYLLFCEEFDKPLGIFRYKNQSGIETNPIIKDDEVIGWQAKFYETKLSSHKKDLIETLRRSKRDYPDITKVIFYTNKDWGQGKNQNDPKAKIDVEQTAAEEKMEIEWRTASFFESPFVSVKNKIIAQYFFSFDKSIIDLLRNKQSHIKSILSEIQTSIDFNNQKIEIDRSKALVTILEELKNKKILILSGVGGVGKTAIIKILHEKLENKIPFYMFKANEFNINKLNDLFSGFGFQDFLEAHKEEKIKIAVIDSAEKLLELKNTDPFRVFLTDLIQNDWKIIFTTRNNYLDDLNFQFFEIHKIIPVNLHIQNLNQPDLEKLASEYNFSLPNDPKLIELIKNPFYLNEYLKFYNEEETTNYLNFKNKLWNKIVRKSEPAREQCFLKTAFLRANESQFFVNPDCDDQTLNKLYQDGILGSETAGYFITHDIYEEWALEKKIDTEFIKKQNNNEFFERIKESLPVRRSFRNWVSEKLLLEDGVITQFIEEIIQDKEIKYFWKDEILVSVLLSNYSDAFFELFKEKLIEKDQKFLKRITLLLGIACKEVDNEFFQKIGIKNINELRVTHIFTKPKGKGWQSLIKFVFNNIDSIKIENIDFIFPTIHDWNSKFREGETTKLSSLMALKYYQWTSKENKHLDKDFEEKLIQTILYGASEIEAELITIFDEILKNKWNNHRDPYNNLIRAILTKIGASIEVIKFLPDYVLKLADLFWFKTLEKEDIHHSGHRGNLPFIGHDPLDLDRNFCLRGSKFDYFPSSAFQTPTYWLLQISLQKTIDFILDFTNKTVECFAKSNYLRESIFEEKVHKIDVLIENGKTNQQYVSDRIWNIYRATEVSPNVLQSIHMALEKFFLERAKNLDPKILESWLLYLLKNTKSASISAIVVSIVLAFPDKTFNVARVLFQTKELFTYDTKRMLLDQTADGLYSIGHGLNFQRDFHQEERIKTCEDEHRKISLEHLALNYQLFRNEETSEKEAERRQKILWNILNQYYRDLPDESEENESDKTWRLYLARMDSRKMSPKTEEKNGKISISFNPEIDSELKKYSETSVNEVTMKMRYMPLKFWAIYKMRNDEQFNQYEEYNNNSKLVLEKLKEVIECFKTSNDPEFFSFYSSIPGDVSSVLIRDYYGELSEDEIKFCNDLILGVASAPLRENYSYQLGDGVDSAISVLPILLSEFPEEKEPIKCILLLTLFNPYPMGVGHEFSDFSKKAILDLWDKSFEDAQSLLLGYLLLKPKYEELRAELRKQNYKKGVYEVHEIQLIDGFYTENEIEIQKVLDNQISIDDLSEIENLNLDILKTAFQLIPSKTNNTEHKELAKTIISTFTKDLLSNKREDKVDYGVRHDFLEKLADFVLSSPEQDISDYLKPFLENFNNAEAMSDLFQRFVYAEDRLEVYNNFWKVWNLFYEKIVELCKNGDNWNTKKIIKSYLFAEIFWRKDATEWHTLKENDKRFFKKLTENTGKCPSVLYSIAKLLNGIGSIYLDDGVLWISRMLNVNENLWSEDLDENTVYYLEKVSRKYVYRNRENLRRTKQLKQEFLVVLDFLIKKGSENGYLLRENIL
jgi:hypothetical protein